MAEGFQQLEFETSLKLSEIQPGQGKKLWLFRVPRHVTTQSLELRVVHRLCVQTSSIQNGTCTSTDQHRNTSPLELIVRHPRNHEDMAEHGEALTTIVLDLHAPEPPFADEIATIFVQLYEAKTREMKKGAKIKLPRKSKEGKVLGRLGTEGANDPEIGTAGLGASFVFRSADSMESAGIRALLSRDIDKGSLAVANAFVGQVNVAVAPPPLPEMGEEGDQHLAPLIEPYRGRPQLRNMRVRAKFAGAGTEYTRGKRRREESTVQSRSKAMEEGLVASNGEKIIGNSRKNAAASEGTTGRTLHLNAEATENTGDGAVTSPTKRKKKKRSSDAGSEGGEQGQAQAPLTAVKPKKSKKRDRLSL